MEPVLEDSLETMNLSGQHQPSSARDLSPNDELDKLLADFPTHPDNTSGGESTSPDSNNDIEQFDIDDLIGSSSDQNDPFPFIQSSDGHDDISKLIEEFSPGELFESEQSQQSTFIECNGPTDFFQSQQVYSPPISVPVGSSPVEPKGHDYSIDVQAFINGQDRLIQTASKPKKVKNHKQRSTTVGPVEYTLHSGGCQPCTTQIQNDFVYQQQSIQYDATESKKIQIIGQPRPEYRPRTQNESKNSSHYLRCEDGVNPEYPTISIPQTWMFQSDINLIEVALMGIDRQPHPYSLDNKTSSATFEDHTLIFKQNDPSVIYFRLTNEDFLNGYKTFMVELIKSKQDEVITKELIRARQLEQSMLCFTRIFQVGKGDFQRDEGSVEYSTTMTEAYGDIDIEHLGPRYGPMSGQEMVYVVLKGRVVKSDLKIEIFESYTGWNYSVENFTKNGNVVYFLMPAFPYPLFETMKANIVIYHKREEIYKTTYLYKGSLDQELAELRLNDSCTTTASSATVANNFNPGNFFAATGVLPSPSTRKASALKRTKRLNKKPLNI